jgi:hypothetical protein
MYHLTFLLIPLLFLSSCSIDWNNEKDKKIAELSQEILHLESYNTTLREMSSKLTDMNRELAFS